MRKNASASKATSKQVKSDKKSKLQNNKSSLEPVHNTTFNHESRTFNIKEERPDIPITLNFDIDSGSESDEDKNIVFEGIEEPEFLPQNINQSKLPFFIEEVEMPIKSIKQGGSSLKGKPSPTKRSPVKKRGRGRPKKNTSPVPTKKTNKKSKGSVVKNVRSIRVSPRSTQPKSPTKVPPEEKVEKKNAAKKLFEPLPPAVPIPVECILKKEESSEDDSSNLVINEEDVGTYHFNQNTSPNWRNPNETRPSVMDFLDPDDPHFMCKKRIFQLEKELSQVKTGYETRIEYLKQELKQQLMKKNTAPKSNFALKQKLLLNMKKKKF